MKKVILAIWIWLPLVVYIYYNFSVKRLGFGADIVLAIYQVCVTGVLYVYYLPPNSKFNIVYSHNYTEHYVQIYFARVPKTIFTWKYHLYIYESDSNILLTKRLFNTKEEAIKWSRTWERL